MKEEPVKVLTIAGSDSGGAAGLQADLKTWTALGVYGMSVVTAVTAQNSLRVAGVEYMSAEFVSRQLEMVLSDYGAHAIKTGFIGPSSLIEAIFLVLRQYEPPHLVVDPVLVNHQGKFMFDEQVIQAYRRQLLPLATIITPNWQEALLLAGSAPDASFDTPNLQKTVDRLHALGVHDILITGHVKGSQIIDYWSDGKHLHALAGPSITTKNVHGSGDTLSSAICAFLATGRDLKDAITEARQFTNQALQLAASWRLGAGHGPLSHFV